MPPAEQNGSGRKKPVELKMSYLPEHLGGKGFEIAGIAEGPPEILVFMLWMAEQALAQRLAPRLGPASSLLAVPPGTRLPTAP